MSGTELPTQEISDEMVELVARAIYAAYWRGGMPRMLDGLPPKDHDYYRDGARVVLAALVASGYRREADVLRHDEEVLLAAWDAAAELLGEAAQGARQRSISANYAEGLADAASTLAETVAEMRARRPATALEQAQPLLAAGSEVESLEPVEPTPAEPVSSTGEEPTDG